MAKYLYFFPDGTTGHQMTPVRRVPGIFAYALEQDPSTQWHSWFESVRDYNVSSQFSWRPVKPEQVPVEYRAHVLLLT